jgi:hypothetical protein
MRTAFAPSDRIGNHHEESLSRITMSGAMAATPQVHVWADVVDHQNERLGVR